MALSANGGVIMASAISEKRRNVGVAYQRNGNIALSQRKWRKSNVGVKMAVSSISKTNGERKLSSNMA
jgi:hypothetical protein